MMTPLKVENPPRTSCRRKPASSNVEYLHNHWTPTSAGVTTSYEAVKNADVEKQSLPRPRIRYGADSSRIAVSGA